MKMHITLLIMGTTISSPLLHKVKNDESEVPSYSIGPAHPQEKDIKQGDTLGARNLGDHLRILHINGGKLALS